MKIYVGFITTLIGAVLLFMLPLTALVDFVWAADTYYVPAVGKKAKRTILVSPQSTQTASGTALLNAVNGITDASAAKPYLVMIEPGVYDIGANSLQMKPFVDLQGSGEAVTKITGNRDSFSAGVLMGATNAEVRFLTVEHTGGGNNALAIYNLTSSPSMIYLTATASGGSFNVGVFNWNSKPAMTYMTVTATGGTVATGVYNSSSSPVMTHVTAAATGGTSAHGVYNEFSLPSMDNVTATASLAITGYGVFNDNSAPSMTNATATASGGTTHYGVYSDNFSITRIDHSLISGSTSTIHNNDLDSVAYVGDTQLEGGAAGGLGTTVCAGVFDAVYTFYASTCP